MKIFATATCAAILAFASANPAAAQDEAGDRVNMVIAYSEADCPEQSAENEIVVCQIVVEADRYRIPPALRYSDDPENNSWAQRVEAFRFVGDFGAMSCSPTGAAGFTGCTQKMIDAAYEAREGGSAARFSQLIAEARAERLSTIDEDAAAEQERVEQIEREYMERLERERQAEVPAEPLPQPESSADD
ncbi:hypothetical protein [Alteriqipengyuania lutimaris]|uniref:DUF1311 domain-containing protein n=1 Tax=Alteriqipengyuania lutimaris TaxID=1538146 RepID=A0A395LP88_9SPHN|nr:hypothetical protein [Alteriqipengyuania lutimaris]MBB3034389.1 hypothetical protein [Alteriqipengyuania lutimaris]RDS78519.1 hypothetical protein DL238_03215 [Alteriqipengyuania lutimaris]